MQSRAAYSWITNQTLHNFSSTVQTFQWWMSATRSVFKQSVQNVHQLQQHMIKVSCEMIRLPYKWTPVANHFISPTKQSSARQCWSALACISDSVPASRPTHGKSRRIWWPFIFSNEIRAILLDPILRTSCCVSCDSVLLKDEVVWQEMSAVFDQIWQELGGEK